MKKEVKNRIITLVFTGYFMLNSLALLAQITPPTGGGSTSGNNLGLNTAANSVWTEVKGSAIYILAAIFLVSALMNIGKVSGSNRDYEGFFRGIGLWFGGITMISAMVTYILSLSF